MGALGWSREREGDGGCWREKMGKWESGKEYRKKPTRKYADNTLVVFGCEVASLCQDEELCEKEAVSSGSHFTRHGD